MNKKVFLADLTHTGNGIIALTFPLGTAYVASYAQSQLGDRFDFRLFKFPNHLSKAIEEEPPTVLALSNYSWNLELSYSLSMWAKEVFPELIVVFGGPNFPITPSEKFAFLKQRSNVDFYIQNEGELGFEALLRKLDEFDFDVAELKAQRELITNCVYLNGDELIEGEVERIKSVNLIPSPYLNGMMDEFFDYPLSPMIETARGCPFSCTFCADGMVIKNKVTRFDGQRVRDELFYISNRIKNIDELTITDLNFGMYRDDVETAGYIAEIQKSNNWPAIVRAAAGKNRPERVIETAALLKGSWVIGSAIQSSDGDVLKNVKRSNISTAAYDEFLNFMNSLDKEAMTYTEIILALPGDTKEKHLDSLKYGIDAQVSSLRMYQAILLCGTDMASTESRQEFGLITRFRIVPGGVGVYRFGNRDFPVAEIEEIIVGGKDMPFNDYVSCRVMNLLIETYLNNDLCEEMFAALRAMDLSVYEFMVYLFEHSEIYTPKVNDILDKFIRATRDDLYESYEEAKTSALSPGLFEQYQSGELGSNELLEHKAMLYSELDDILFMLQKAITMYLDNKGLLTSRVKEYFDQLTKLILYKKREVHNLNLEAEHSFKYDFATIAEAGYVVDPRELAPEKMNIIFKFSHSDEQRELIKNAVSLYENHPGGISRMLYRQNLKKMYRAFQRV